MPSIGTSPTQWKEARRKRALELKACGWKQRQVAEAVGVTEAAVSRRLARARTQGPDAWRARPRPCGPRELTREELRLIPDLLSHGAEAYGFGGGVWTCARVAAVLRYEFGVTYHRAHVPRLLKQLGCTPQLPVEQAAHRDERLIERWGGEVWPELKKRPSMMPLRWPLAMHPDSVCCRVACAPTPRVARGLSRAPPRPGITCQ